MKKLLFQSSVTKFSILFFALFIFAGNTTFAQNNDNKNVWIFKNSTGQAANDLHMEFRVGCLPTNLPADENGIRRAGGVFVNFPTQGSPSNHDYSGGEVADGDEITLQFDNATRLKKWWWTKDGQRIGDIERANSEDLSTIAYEPNIPDYLVYKPRGTGQTTGHIADLSIYNPTQKPVTLTIPVCFIPSDGRFQSYAVSSEENVTVGVNKTVTVPLKGYCADIYKPAVPSGTEMPDIQDWILEDQEYLASIPQEVITGAKPLGNIPGEVTPTVPGTDTPITAVINGNDNPELFAQLTIAAFKNLKKASLDLQDQLPMSNIDAVVQQSGWIYTAALTGNDYKIEQLKENGRKQYETNTGNKFKHAPDAVKKEFEEGVQNLWDSFTLVGQEAKVLNVDEG